ncbi:MAG: N-acetyltransferase [Geminicoccaceae bacterium]
MRPRRPSSHRGPVSGRLSLEDLVPLVRDLLQDPTVSTALVAERDGHPVGSVIFTRCAVAGSAAQVALLGPLAVQPPCQRRGVGGSLVRDGFGRLGDQGIARVLVLGDPAYYGRFGFRQDMRIEPPYPLPGAWAGAWQSVALGDTGGEVAGRLEVPPAWRRPELWGP